MEELKPLDALEREWFTEIQDHVTFKKAMLIVNAQKPGVFPTDNFGVTAEQQRKKETDRLYEIRGWEMREKALESVTLIEVKKPPPEPMPVETYGIENDNIDNTQ